MKPAAPADPVYQAFLKLDTGTHTGAICQLAVTPDGTTLVSAGECTIRLWDLETLTLQRQLLGQADERSEEQYGNGNVAGFALSPDGRFLVALKDWFGQAGADRGRRCELQVFELATGNLRAACMLPGTASSLEISPDGRYLALAGTERQARTRHAVVEVFSFADLLRADFRGPPQPLGRLRLAKAPAKDTLWAAVRFVPEALRRRRGYRLVVAVSDKADGRLGWLRFEAKTGLVLQREECGLGPLSPATLTLSHAHAVVARAGVVREGGRRVGQCWWRSHDDERAGVITTNAEPVSAAFSNGGCHLLLGFAQWIDGYALKGPGDETVAVNAYATTGMGFALQSSYFGHDNDIDALCFVGGQAVSSGGDNHAIHFWDCSHRIGRQSGAIRGVGQSYCLPGVDSRERVLFGTVPARLLPKRQAVRQQCFDLRAMDLRTTEDRDLRAGDWESKKWLIFDFGTQVLGLRYNPDAYDAELDKAPDLSLFIASNDEWLIWTRSGYYNASKGGERLMGYQVCRGPQQEALFLPADRFKAFYRPDIVQAVVRHGSEARARAAGVDIPVIDVTRLLPPYLELLQADVEGQELLLRIAASWTSAQAAPKRVWLLRNGRFVWSSNEARPEYELRLRLLPGRNVLTVLADNGQSRSMPLTHEVEGPEHLAALREQTASSGKLFLLAVGVSDFEVAGTEAAGRLKALPYPHQDAIAVHNAFAASRRSKRRLPGAPLRNKAFDAVEAALLVNEEASKAAILRELDRLCDAIRTRAEADGAERDVLFVFLAGHGTRFVGEPELFFWNYDLHPARMEETGLSMVELGERISAVPAEVVVVLDTCHSGMAGGNVMSGLNAEEIARRLQAVNERGMYVLSAARSEERARDSHADAQGVFTSALLGALYSERFLVPDPLAPRAHRSRAISMMSLMAGTQELLPQVSAKAGTKPQTPVLRMYGDLLPLTIYKT